MRRTSSLFVGALVLAPLVAIASCGGDDGGAKPTPDAGTGSGGKGQGGAGEGGDGEGGGLVLPDAGNLGGAGGCEGMGGCSEVAPFCGDAKIDPGEKCDDGNSEPGDGCAANCQSVENDFSCPQPGAPCVSTVVCGDAKVGGLETCDDQNITSGDGCDSSCKVEPGWQCLTIGKKCEAAACGDGLIVGKEECEDGNTFPGDGCDDACRLEYGWKCPTAGSACVPTVCGDGLVEGKEPCDDGNNNMGDGCTPFCVREPDCSAGACASTCGDGIKLPNGAEQCEDGNTVSGDGCSSDCQIEPGFMCDDIAQNGGNTLEIPLILRDFKIAHPDFEDFNGEEKGIVASTLGMDGKPVYANQGGTTSVTSGAANFNQWYNDVAGINKTVLQTMTLTKLMSGAFQYADTSFFPLDGIGWDNEGNAHNFHFTSEVRYWFEYKGGEKLDFTGDDDVWVFVNKKLALDLGGVHGPQSGSVVLNPAKAAELGLTIGNVYETVVFQAERHTNGSKYTLTLSNFVNTESVCLSVCGDGILTPDEVCDDGVNDGSYGSCTPDCNKGPYCGDGVVQAANNEQCDDGVNLMPYGGCAPGCQNGSYCGDGVVDSLFGEQCDDAVNDGGYEECAPDCVRGPRCGDGILQPEEEECDDGNKKSGDGCDPLCNSEVPV